MAKKKVLRVAVFMLLTLLLAACAPQLGRPQGSLLLSAEAEQIRQLAQIAWHRMELNYLETQRYSTNVLVDLELPKGVLWTLEDFADDYYRLRFSSSAAPGVVWLVTPSGVETRQIMISSP